MHDRQPRMFESDLSNELQYGPPKLANTYDLVEADKAVGCKVIRSFKAEVRVAHQI